MEINLEKDIGRGLLVKVQEVSFKKMGISEVI